MPAAAENARAVVRRYRKRWTIEEFFRIPKSGLRVEERRFDHAEDLRQCFAFAFDAATACRALPESWAGPVAVAPPAMKRACEGDKTRQLVHNLGMTPVVPPKANRKAKWNYDRKTYKMRNEIERLFRRFKGYRRLFTRFDKLDATFPGFLNLAAVFEMTHDLA